jgi:hypothetical protein
VRTSFGHAGSSLAPYLFLHLAATVPTSTFCRVERIDFPIPGLGPVAASNRCLGPCMVRLKSSLQPACPPSLCLGMVSCPRTERLPVTRRKFGQPVLVSPCQDSKVPRFPIATRQPPRPFAQRLPNTHSRLGPSEPHSAQRTQLPLTFSNIPSQSTTHPRSINRSRALCRSWFPSCAAHHN